MDTRNLLYVCILLWGDCGDLSYRFLADDTTALLRVHSFSLRDPSSAVQLSRWNPPCLCFDRNSFRLMSSSHFLLTLQSVLSDSWKGKCGSFDWIPLTILRILDKRRTQKSQNSRQISTIDTRFDTESYERRFALIDALSCSSVFSFVCDLIANVVMLLNPVGTLGNKRQIQIVVIAQVLWTSRLTWW